MARPNQQTVNDLCFNLLIVGDGGSGKTTLLKSHLSGESGMTYEPIYDADVYPLDFFTNRGGKIRFYCWETAGHVPVPPLYGDCAIIMFDVTARPTHLPSWLGKLFRSCAKEIPVVLCGNKIDLGGQMRAEQLTFARKKKLQFCEISAKSNHNIEKPFLYLARKLAGDANLHFVESPPPEVQFVAQAQVEAELVLLNMNDDNTFE